MRSLHALLTIWRRREMAIAALVVGAVAWLMWVNARHQVGRQLAGFSPERIAELEQRAWQAYYQRRWMALFILLLRITSGQFGLPLWRAIYPTFLATRAQLVFARQGAADRWAERDMRRFYEIIRTPTGGRYDPVRVAEAEIRWWIVHRHRADAPDNGLLVDALADLYAALYDVGRETVHEAALHRARAMDVSDQWVREGAQTQSPRLDQIRTELLASYRALKTGVVTDGQSPVAGRA